MLAYERIIAKAADDPNIGMIFLMPDSFDGDIAQTEEIRNSLLKFKESGKPIISYITGSNNYYLASVADTVCMNPSGSVRIMGITAMTAFYGELLDTLKVGIQAVRHGEYKSAIEPYTRKEMSDKSREQYSQYLKSVWSEICSGIASSRNIDAAEFNKWVDNLELFSPESMLRHRLVDKLMYKDEMKRYLEDLSGLKEKCEKKLVYASDYLKKIKTHGRDEIAVIRADGTLSDNGTGVDCDHIAALFEKARKNSKIKAVIFRINSPGGEVYTADAIRREMNETKKVKPVIASFGNYAASGGYLISSEANYIFTDKSTITGSIGVFCLIPEFGETLDEKLHIGLSTVSTNEHGDAITGTRKMTAFELEVVQKHVDDCYDKFVKIVSDGRKMDYERVDSLAGGHIWSGEDAVRLGLADSYGSLLDAVEYAARTVGLEKYSTIALTHNEPNLFSQIIRKKQKKPLVTAEEPDLVQLVHKAISSFMDAKESNKIYALCPTVVTRF